MILKTSFLFWRTALPPLFHPDYKIDWLVSQQPVPYPKALRFMEQRVADIIAGTAQEAVWLLEHPSLYTAGTSTNTADLKDADRFPVFQTGRGGQYTYHGPGQRVAYVMLDLNKRKKDIRLYVQELENWLIDTLGGFDVVGEVRDKRVGIWVEHEKQGQKHEDKIAAIGVRVRKWVTFHGISLNVSPNLEHFTGIVPCGITQYGVTSLQDLGLKTTMTALDAELKSCFEKRFGATL